jgi:hypothetical protein
MTSTSIAEVGAMQAPGNGTSLKRMQSAKEELAQLFQKFQSVRTRARAARLIIPCDTQENNRNTPLSDCVRTVHILLCLKVLEMNILTPQNV